MTNFEVSEKREKSSQRHDTLLIVLIMATLKSASEISRLENPPPGFHEIQFCSQLPARIVPVNAQQSFPVNSPPLSRSAWVSTHRSFYALLGERNVEY